MIDISVYRLRIGTFRQVTNVNVKIRCSSTKRGLSVTSFIGLFLLMMFILTCLIALCLQEICYVEMNIFKDSKISSFFQIYDGAVKQFYFATMTGNFFARYINGNISKASKGLKVFHVNIRSLQNKVNEIKKIIEDHKPHIIGCSECELRKVPQSDIISKLKIPGYQLILPKSWESHEYARVVVYIKKSLEYERLDVLEDDHLQTIWIKCGFINTKKGYICHGYREHSSNMGSSVIDQTQKLTTFLDQWDRAINFGNPPEPNDVFILCDMNLDSFEDRWLDPKYHLYSLAQLVHRQCNMNNITQLVKSITRVQYNSICKKTNVSCIDHIYTNVKFKCSNPEVINFGSSDHDIIGFTRLSRKPPEVSKTIRKRSYKWFEKEQFLSDLSEIDWSDVLACPDLDYATELFTRKFKFVLDQHAPWILYQERKNYKPWITKETLDLMKERDYWKGFATKLSLSNNDQASIEEQNAWVKFKKFEK